MYILIFPFAESSVSGSTLKISRAAASLFLPNNAQGRKNRTEQ